MTAKANKTESKKPTVFAGPCVLALGVFDGVHLGHLMVIKKAASAAKRLRAKVGVFTFRPHPSKITKTREVKLISGIPERVEELKNAGADFVHVQEFDPPFSKKSPQEFMEFLKEIFPNLKAVITGENFHFGSGAEGSADWLNANAKNFGIKYFRIEGFMLGKERVSSSRLRCAIEAGKMELCESMMGRPYSAEGKVVGGKKLGRTIGFPTLNINYSPECRPPYGVYLVMLSLVSRTKKFSSLGVANYGLNPSVENLSQPVLEMNLFKTPNFGAGAKIKVELKRFIRSEKKFSSLDALKKQIAKDKAKAFRLAASSL